MSMGATAKTLSQLINGQANISNDLAKKLSEILGISVEVWQNLQNTYDQKLIEIQQAKDVIQELQLEDYSMKVLQHKIGAQS